MFREKRDFTDGEALAVDLGILSLSNLTQADDGKL